jgi:hypothetical protein
MSYYYKKLTKIGLIFNTNYTQFMYNFVNNYKNNIKSISLKSNAEVTQKHCKNTDGLNYESLKDCKLLTYLKLDLFSISDHFFKEIEKYLPQLKHLYIKALNM